MALGMLLALSLSAFLLYALLQGATTLPGYKAWIAGASLALLAALYCGWRMQRNLRHAYIIVSRLGIEVLPEFFCQKNLLLVRWSEIDGYSVENNQKLVLNMLDGARFEIKLAPLNSRQCRLLDTAIAGQIANSAAQRACPAGA